MMPVAPARRAHTHTRARTCTHMHGCKFSRTHARTHVRGCARTAGNRNSRCSTTATSAATGHSKPGAEQRADRGAGREFCRRRRWESRTCAAVRKGGGHAPGHPELSFLSSSHRCTAPSVHTQNRKWKESGRSSMIKKFWYPLRRAERATGRVHCSSDTRSGRPQRHCALQGGLGAVSS